MKSFSKPHPSMGDVIGVDRTFYKHFGIYVSDDFIVHYASASGDFGKGPLYVHKTSLVQFLSNQNQYFIYIFPKYPGLPNQVMVQHKVSFVQTIQWWLKMRKFSKELNYHLYNPEETVQRALSRIGETKYNLIFNNCEHFAIWCKTGVSESHQVNRILDMLPKTFIKNDKNANP